MTADDTDTPAFKDPAQPLKLPRQTEEDSRYPEVVKKLTADQRPIWEKGKIAVSHVQFSAALRKALESLLLNKRLERGLENIERILANEEKGLAALRARQKTAPAYRVSRLLLMSDEGTERFYRSCESLLHRHADRLLGIRIVALDLGMSESLFGPASQVKAILVSDKEAVSNVLLSLG